MKAIQEFIVIFFIVIPRILGSSHFNIDLLPTEDLDEEVLKLLNEDLLEMRKELTASFVAHHSRQKRDTQEYEHQLVFEDLKYTYGPNTTSRFKTDPISSRVVIFQEDIYVLEQFGLHKIDFNHEYNNKNATSGAVDKNRARSWTLMDDARVLASIEKNDVLFILITSPEEDFTFLFTYSPVGSGRVILRQRIRNYGTVTDAKFFIYYDTLYLVITHDNQVHSITMCPIFKWMGTYLDEIHTVHTRGANSVDLYVIAGYQYMAIAQAVDSAGNSEIGTQLLRMDRHEEIEKVQLLYTKAPTELHFTQFLHEHILIIAQETEKAMVYFFGGYDFIFLQHLPIIMGSNVTMVSVLGPDGETYILASNGVRIYAFSRAESTSPLASLMFSPYENATYEAPAGFVITGMTVKPPKNYNPDEPYKLVLAINLASKKEHVVDLYFVAFERHPKAKSTQKPPEDKLSICMMKLEKILLDGQPHVHRIEHSSEVILRKSKKMNFDGQLVVGNTVTIDSDKMKAGDIKIQPKVKLEHDSPMSPTEILESVEEDREDYHQAFQEKFKTVLLRNETRTISGSLVFPNGVEVENLQANRIELNYLNEISWQRILRDTLKVSSKTTQVVTGNWSFETVEGQDVETPALKNIRVEDILLTETPNNAPQLVRGRLHFTNDVTFEANITVPRQGYINDIHIGDIVVTRPDKPTVITGKKTADYVHGGSQNVVHLVNGMRLDSWYNSVLKTKGPEQQAGVFVFNAECEGYNVSTTLFNGRNWNEFIYSVLTNGTNQTLQGEPGFNQLAVDHLTVNEINGIRISDLLTTNEVQNVYIPIYLKELVLHGKLDTETLNELRIPEDVVMMNENSTIYSPVVFHNLTTQHLDMENLNHMSGADLEGLLNGRKTVVYRSVEPIRLSTMETTDTFITEVNGVAVSNFNSRYWTKNGPNDIHSHLNLSTVPVYVNDFHTDKINQVLVEDYVHIGENTTIIKSQLQFNAPVTVHGNVNMAPAATLNGMDLSEYVKRIVHRYDTGRVYGRKTFTKPLNVSQGIYVKNLNGYDVSEDFVLLSGGSYTFSQGLRFRELYATDIEVNGPIEVNGTVNGLNLQYVNENTATEDEPLSIQSDVIFERNVRAEDFNVGGQLNGLSIPDLLSRYILLDSGDKPQYLYVNLVAENNLIFNEDVTVGMINGVNPSAYFASLVNRSMDENIEGTKIFHGPVTVQGDFLCPTMNNISLKALEDEAISRAKPQNISGSTSFSEIRANNVRMKTICGIPLSDFVRVNDGVPQFISSPVVFATTNGTTIVHGDIKLKGQLNGQNISQVAQGISNIHGKRQFTTVTCTDNLSWEVSDVNLKGFSYLFSNAVTTSGMQQPITGSVTFLQGFISDNITTTEWFNGVNLKYLQEDGVFADRPVNFTGKKYVREVHVGHTGSITGIGTLSTEVVNGVNLTELNQNIVRRNDTKVITEKKIFQNDLVIENLIVDEINGCKVKDIALVDDERIIEDVLLEHVEGLQDLNFQNLKDFNWSDFLERRLTLNTDQTIEGDWVFMSDVEVEDLRVQILNGLDVATAVLENSEKPQVVSGVKTISSLHIKGNIETVSINGKQIRKLYSRMIFNDEPAQFNQTVYLEGPAIFKENLDIQDKLNNHTLQNIEDGFSAQLRDARQELDEAELLRAKTQDLLKTLDEELDLAAMWLDYLRTDVELTNTNSRRVEATVLDQSIAQIVFSSMIRVKNYECALPVGCLANRYEVFEYSTPSPKRTAAGFCENAFYLAPGVYPVGFKIISNAVSYNQTCQTEAVEETKIFAQLPSVNGKVTEALIGSIQTGFVTDAKTFHWRGFDYIVISQLFDKRKSSGSVLVYAVINDASLELVQEILTIGTVKLAISFTDSYGFLALANTLTHVPVTNSETVREDLDHCETSSGIYAWIPSQTAGNHGKFSLLREVATRNIIDLQFVGVYPFRVDFYYEPLETFAVFIHSISLIEVFKWNPETDNFQFFQTIALDDEYQVTGITSLNLRDSTYLVISSIPKGLLIYEYRCVEGFQLYLEVPLEQAYDVTSLQLNNRLLLPCASTKSLITVAEIQGPRLE